MQQPLIDFYLHPAQVEAMIKTAEAEGEVIVVRCVRKGAASKPGGPDQDDYQDLHCGPKPKRYKAAGIRNRKTEDVNNGVLTVFVTNRQDPQTGAWGCWRRVNVQQVKKIIYRGHEWEIHSK
jgi:hypothetical protein